MGWQLQDVQAAVNVVITVLSALAIFAFVRFCWQRAATNVAKGRDVPLYSLLSLNTLGEVFDVTILLNRKLISRRYVYIVAQCVVVVFLSATAILSGPIARYTTQRGYVIKQEEVPGLLASRSHNSMGYANVEWNLTMDRLDQAGFPMDQLIDYLPDNSINWKYDAAQWNNSWTMSCERTLRTPIDLQVTNNCTKLRYELPGLEKAFSYRKWDNYSFSWDGFYDTPTRLKDVLMFWHGITLDNYADSQETYQSINFMLTTFHLHGVKKAPQNATDCNFGAGNIEQASYTKIECDVRRKDLSDDQDYFDLAFPDVGDSNQLALAYTAYYQSRFSRETTTDTPITELTPDDLVRFYQVYTAVKDMQYRQPVMRNLNVEVRVVQLSTVFLAVAILVAVLICVSLATYGIFAIRHFNVMANTPQSKLDWMVQSIQAEDRPYADTNGTLRRSVTVDSASHTIGMARFARRNEFETAKYGGRETTTWFLKDSPRSSGYLDSSRMYHGEAVLHRGSAQIVQNDKTPMLSEVVVTEGTYQSRM